VFAIVVLSVKGLTVYGPRENTGVDTTDLHCSRAKRERDSAKPQEMQIID
jgi:hypothetical protein